MIYERNLQIIQNNECSKCEARYICKWCPAYASIFNVEDETTMIKFFCDLSKKRLSTFI